MDVIVSIAVIAILVGLLLPTIAGVREATRKVVCSSNIRQVGIGLSAFANDHRDDLPLTNFAKSTPAESSPQQMTTLRLGESVADWDGLGVLHHLEYLPGPGVYYCPSHVGEHPLRRYADRWASGDERLVGNYQYRGSYAVGQTLNLRRLAPHVGLAADGLATATDYSHGVGANVLTADNSVFWFFDNGRVRDLLPKTQEEANAAQRVEQAWTQIDQAAAMTGGRPPE